LEDRKRGVSVECGCLLDPNPRPNATYNPDPYPIKTPIRHLLRP